MDLKITPEQRLDNKVLQGFVEEIIERKQQQLNSNSKNMNFIKNNKKVRIYMEDIKENIRLNKIQQNQSRFQRVLDHNRQMLQDKDYENMQKMEIKAQKNWEREQFVNQMKYSPKYLQQRPMTGVPSFKKHQSSEQFSYVQRPMTSKPPVRREQNFLQQEQTSIIRESPDRHKSPGKHASPDAKSHLKIQSKHGSEVQNKN